MTDDLYREVLDLFEMELDVYLHRQTQKVIGLPNESSAGYFDEEEWEPEWSQISKNREDYLLIEQFYPPEVYKMYRRFTWRVENEALSDRLFKSLDGRGGLRRFRDIVFYETDLAKQWNEYEENYKLLHIKTMIERYYREEE